MRFAGRMHRDFCAEAFPKQGKMMKWRAAIMDTMRALVYDRPGEGSIRDLPMPTCGPDDVIIQVVSASICKGADRRHQTTGHALGKYPITTGHEFAGYV